MIENLAVDFDLDIFRNADYTQHYGSCISYQVKEQKDQHAGGFPESYSEDNTRIQQIWFEDTDVDYEMLGKHLNMDVKTVSAILQPPGNTVTLHRDTFFKFKSLYPDDTRPKVRANIYLEDWKVGHLIQYQDINDNGIWKTSDNWKAGEGYLWSSDVLHLSANAGMKPKFTLQISGFYLG